MECYRLCSFFVESDVSVLVSESFDGSDNLKKHILVICLALMFENISECVCSAVFLVIT